MLTIFGWAKVDTINLYIYNNSQFKLSMVSFTCSHMCDSSRFYNLRDTLKPNRSGYVANNLLSRVLFPEPEGPATTRGRGIVGVAFTSSISC